MNRLLAIAAAIDERPTLEQTDAMLAELGQLRSHPATLAIIDALLDYRSLLALSQVA
jgi:hypothetical protein